MSCRGSRCGEFFRSLTVAYTNFVLEPNARRHDNMGFNMPLAMVQADINSTSLYPRNLDNLTRAATSDSLPEQG
jgi:hypothetical protein